MVNQRSPFSFATAIRWLSLCSLCLMLIACGSSTSNTKKNSTQTASPYAFVDSTEYLDNETSSVSMRATFTRGSNAEMAEGYKFQFRTLRQTPIFLSSISIVSGGKRLFLEENQVVLSNQRGLTLSLPLSESKFIAQYPSALLQFKYNNESYLLAIELHQLKPFSPNQN